MTSVAGPTNCSISAVVPSGDDAVAAHGEGLHLGRGRLHRDDLAVPARPSSPARRPARSRRPRSPPALPPLPPPATFWPASHTSSWSRGPTARRRLGTLAGCRAACQPDYDRGDAVLRRGAAHAARLDPARARGATDAWRPSRVRAGIRTRVPPDLRDAAGLLLVYPHAGVWQLPLTLRASALRHHTGQVSLPGGRVDAGETLEQAALREALRGSGHRARRRSRSWGGCRRSTSR